MPAPKKKPAPKKSIKKTAKSPSSKGNSVNKILGFLLVLSSFSLVFFIFNSYQYKQENQKLKKITQLLTPTQSPLLKDYTEDSFMRPKDIPESTSSSKMKLPIIMYHYVEYVKDRRDVTRLKLAVTPDVLEMQLIAIKSAGYDTYFVRDIPDIISKKIEPDKAIVLTFDDGYEDFYLNVYPLLKRYNMRATNYVIVNYIGRKDFMNPKQIQELIDSDLVEIGSHTLDHIPLKTATAEESRKQIFESKTRLETQFNIKVKSFAYPSGSFSLRDSELVKEAGYTVGLSTISGDEQSEDNMYYLNRLRPGLFDPKKN
jgi:peptidoglycan/xylan/chitin deacetylase (PgdA/CDA1 family)